MNLVPAAPANPPQQNENQSEDDLPPQTWREYLKMVLTRTAILAAILYASFLLPNINVILTIGGAVLGFLLTVAIPVLFYNAAYSEERSRSRGEVESE